MVTTTTDGKRYVPHRSIIQRMSDPKMKELAQKRNQEAAAEEIREALGQLIARVQDAEQYGVRTYISVDSDETRIPVKHVIKSRISADL